MSSSCRMIAAVMVLLAAVGLVLAPTVSAEAPGVTVRLESANLGFPSPFTHYPRQRGHLMKHIFDSLLEAGEDGYIPWLAKDWQISDDGREHTIRIREGVRFHDGTPLTAHDAAFSFRYYQEYPPVFLDDQVLDSNFLLHIEAVSDYELHLVTARPSATFYAEAGQARILPAHIWDSVTEPYDYMDDAAVIGSGPFQLADYRAEHNTYRFVANEDFWGPTPRVQSLELVPVSDSILAFQRGDIHLTRISPDLVPMFEADPGVRVVESPAFSGTLLSLNLERVEALQNPELRRALSLAIDRDLLVEQALRGAGRPGGAGILPVEHADYHGDLPALVQDQEEARRLLAAIGELPTLELLATGEQELRMAEILREQLADVGVSVSVQSVDQRTRDSLVFEGRFELALVTWGSWGLDPDYLRMRYASTAGPVGISMGTGLTGHGYHNPAFDELALQQASETDPQRRRELIGQMQEILAEDRPEIPLVNSYHIFVYRPGYYDGWRFMFYHPVLNHSKLSYLDVSELPGP